MKKSFIYLLSVIAVAVFTAVSLTSCGEEVNIDPVAKSKTTVFAAETGSTRTSMDADRWFYWTIGDKIWVDNGSTYIKSVASNITGNKQARAKFTLEGDYNGLQYNVLYTGYTGTFAKDTTNTSSTTVTIADQQTQSAWSNGNHLAVSGDCGKAVAYRQPSGQYSFSLEHQASYLVFYPYLNSTLSSGNYTLQRIEIYSDASGSNIAGQYDFTFANGLNDMPIAGTGKQEITLTCDGGFALRTDQPDLTSPTTYNHCFVVIAPGSHTLTIKYVVKNSSNTTLEFIQDIASMEYSPNTVYPFIYELSNAEMNYGLVFNEDNLVYKWGATAPDGTNLPGSYITEINLPGTFWETVPNLSEAAWYMNTTAAASKTYWDNSMGWTFNRSNGTTETRRGGLWVKRRKYVTGFTDATASPHRTAHIPILGRPDASVIHQYFFLPAFEGVNAETIYWLKTPLTTAGTTTTPYAYVFAISSSNVKHYDYRGKTTWRVAGYRPDTGNTPGYDEEYKNYWFQ